MYVTVPPPGSGSNTSLPRAHPGDGTGLCDSFPDSGVWKGKPSTRMEEIPAPPLEPGGPGWHNLWCHMDATDL